ncbi:hypothetical protein MUY35_15175 [Aliiroseovarius sp. S1339]|uniref:hypothetical protein n=1 Tax=Aliiroseovarius sp. S1339 TaxID=2936990 RepID=UPI0020BE883A|nr:hypothetical protein [Aliiroseovarius sp. S1339]MCK8465200.1 hypothetical protein [Aliiroseovarius sp. S1339]
MTNTIRVLVPIDSHDKNALQTALAYAKKICEQENFSDVVLLTHTKNQLTQTSLSGFLGKAVVQTLAKGTASLSGGIKLHAETMRTMSQSARKSVVLVYYAEQSILDFVDGLHNIGGVVVVPEFEGEADDWSQRWGVVVHGEKRQEPATLIEDQTVVKALETLTQIVNLSTGLGNPRDKEHANTVLRILRAKGHADPSPHIKSWAIQHGWRPKDGLALEELSRKIWNLKSKPSLSGFYNVEERYQSWRDDGG